MIEWKRVSTVHDQLKQDSSRRERFDVCRARRPRLMYL